MNEQTGDGEESLKVWSDGQHQGVANTEHPYFTKKELKDALKKFKANQDDVKDKEAVRIPILQIASCIILNGKHNGSKHIHGMDKFLDTFKKLNFPTNILYKAN